MGQCLPAIGLEGLHHCLAHMCQGPVSPVLSPSAPCSVGAGSAYGVTQLPSSASAFAGPYPTFPSLAGPSSSAQERGFPERPGQPDCQNYLKTGDCKFGSSCRFHHPPDWVVSKTNCLLSPMGLPMCPVYFSNPLIIFSLNLRVNLLFFLSIFYFKIPIANDKVGSPFILFPEDFVTR